MDINLQKTSQVVFIFSLISNEKNTKCIKMLCTVLPLFSLFFSGECFGDRAVRFFVFCRNPLRHTLQVEEAVTMATVYISKTQPLQGICDQKTPKTQSIQSAHRSCILLKKKP